SNYRDVLLTPTGQRSIVCSLLFVFGSLAIVIPLGMLLALLLNEPLRGRGVLRVLLMTPWVVSELITALLWKWTITPNVGPLPLILTGGGPLQVTEVLPLKLFKEAFEFFRLGKSSAIAIVLLGFNFVLTLAYFRLIRPFEEVT